MNLLPVTEEASRVAGLRTGDFDFAEALSITAVPDLEQDSNIKVEIVASSSRATVSRISSSSPSGGVSG